MRSLGDTKIRTRAPQSVDTSFKRQFFKGFLRMLGIAVLLGVTFYVTHLQAFTITTVEVSGGETISHDTVRARVMDELNTNYFHIIPKRFTYLYPHDRISASLQSIPRIHDVFISRASETKLEVTFEEYIPYALWCVEGQDDKPCYFLNSEGYAFTEAPVLRGGALVRHAIEGLSEISQGHVIDKAKLTDIDTFIALIRDKLNFRVATVVHRKSGDYEFVLGGGGAIYTSHDINVQTTFANLHSVLTSKEFEHIKPSNFKYIDVRFGNKIFVNEEMNEATTTTESTLKTATST
jgi:hypothetical protein